MFCENCGAEITEKSKFCLKCGAPNPHYTGNDTGSTKMQPKASVNQQNHTNSQTPRNLNVQPPEKKKGKGKTIAIAAGVVVVLGIAFATLSSGSSDDNTKSTEAETVKETEISSTKETEAETVKETEAEKSEPKYSAHDPAEMYKLNEDNDVMPYTVSDNAEEFLTEYKYFFPAMKEIDVNTSPLVDTEFDPRVMEKSPENAGKKLIYLPAMYVTQIKEADLDDGTKFTEIIMADINTEQIYYGLYDGELPDILSDDIVSVIGLPIANGSFENVQNTTTLTIILACSEIKKVDVEAEDSYEVHPAAGDDTDAYLSESDEAMPDYSSEYIFPESSSRYLTDADVAGMDAATIRIGLNEIYARYGREFTSEDLNNYFNSTSWYVPSVPADQFDESVLNEYEKYNVRFLADKRNG